MPAPDHGRAIERVLVLDLAATSRNWALPADAERAIRAAAPEGWRIRAVRSPTSSDGDGAATPSDEALQAVADAEVYFGFGITRPLFLAATALQWVHSAAAGVRGALFPEMLASPVLLTNSAGIHAIPIAETVVGGYSICFAASTWPSSSSTKGDGTRAASSPMTRCSASLAIVAC